MGGGGGGGGGGREEAEVLPAAVVLSASELQAGVRRVARELSAAYPEGFVLLAVLKGSVLFVADLVRELSVPVEIDFLSISAYAEGTGRVRLVKDVEVDISGRDVVLVEDIVDTGLTLTYVLGVLERRSPRSLAACALFDKRVRRIVPAELAFVGFEVPDRFLLGYGLDYEQRYRNLDVVVAGDVAALRDDPDAYVRHLFGG